MTRSMPSNNQHRVFHDYDIFVVPLGDWGVDGLFVHRSSIDTGWEFVPPRTVAWDSFHQGLFRSHRYDECRDQDILRKLPPLPTPSTSQSLTAWHENFGPSEVFNNLFPQLERALRNKSREGLGISPILKEDLYETRSGDGAFHYYDRLFLTRRDAEAYAQKNMDKHTAYHVLSLSIGLEDDRILSNFFMPVWPQHFSMERILQDLETHYSKGRV